MSWQIFNFYNSFVRFINAQIKKNEGLKGQRKFYIVEGVLFQALFQVKEHKTLFEFQVHW